MTDLNDFTSLHRHLLDKIDQRLYHLQTHTYLQTFYRCTVIQKMKPCHVIFDVGRTPIFYQQLIDIKHFEAGHCHSNRDSK